MPTLELGNGQKFKFDHQPSQAEIQQAIDGSQSQQPQAKPTPQTQQPQQVQTQQPPSQAPVQTQQPPSQAPVQTQQPEVKSPFEQIQGPMTPEKRAKIMELYSPDLQQTVNGQVAPTTPLNTKLRQTQATEHKNMIDNQKKPKSAFDTMAGEQDTTTKKVAGFVNEVYGGKKAAAYIMQKVMKASPEYAQFEKDVAAGIRQPDEMEDIIGEDVNGVEATLSGLEFLAKGIATGLGFTQFSQFVMKGAGSAFAKYLAIEAGPEVAGNILEAVNLVIHDDSLSEKEKIGKMSKSFAVNSAIDIATPAFLQYFIKKPIKKMGAKIVSNVNITPFLSKTTKGIQESMSRLQKSGIISNMNLENAPAETISDSLLVQTGSTTKASGKIREFAFDNFKKNIVDPVYQGLQNMKKEAGLEGIPETAQKMIGNTRVFFKNMTDAKDVMYKKVSTAISDIKLKHGIEFHSLFEVNRMKSDLVKVDNIMKSSPAGTIGKKIKEAGLEFPYKKNQLDNLLEGFNTDYKNSPDILQKYGREFKVFEDVKVSLDKSFSLEDISKAKKELSNLKFGNQHVQARLDKVIAKFGELEDAAFDSYQKNSGDEVFKTKIGDLQRLSNDASDFTKKGETIKSVIGGTAQDIEDKFVKKGNAEKMLSQLTNKDLTPEQLDTWVKVFGGKEETQKIGVELVGRMTDKVMTGTGAEKVFNLKELSKKIGTMSNQSKDVLFNAKGLQELQDMKKLIDLAVNGADKYGADWLEDGLTLGIRDITQDADKLASGLGKGIFAATSKTYWYLKMTLINMLGGVTQKNMKEGTLLNKLVLGQKGNMFSAGRPAGKVIKKMFGLSNEDIAKYVKFQDLKNAPKNIDYKSKLKDLNLFNTKGPKTNLGIKAVERKLKKSSKDNLN